jgi:glycosyltransferase involved in cell wall biosynthesis
MPDYSIIVPAYNEAALIGATLDRLRAVMDELSEWEGELIVTDNNSTDNTAEIASAHGATVVFEAHRQISWSRNAGGRAASGRFLIFVDADTLVSAKLVRHSLERLEGGSCCGGGGTIAIPSDTPLAMRIMLKLWTLASYRMRWACGAYVFCLKTAFDAVEGFAKDVYCSEELHFSAAVRRWGKPLGMRFEILRETLTTSMRKFEWYTPRQLVGQMIMFGLFPGRMKRREACGLWYTRPK